MPSYSVTVCFMKGMCKAPEGSEIVTRHANAALIWLISINFLGNIFFITSIYKLRNIKKEFNIRRELMVTFAMWFLTT